MNYPVIRGMYESFCRHKVKVRMYIRRNIRDRRAMTSDMPHGASLVTLNHNCTPDECVQTVMKAVVRNVHLDTAPQKKAKPWSFNNKAFANMPILKTLLTHLSAPARAKVRSNIVCVSGSHLSRHLRRRYNLSLFPTYRQDSTYDNTSALVWINPKKRANQSKKVWPLIKSGFCFRGKHQISISRVESWL